MSELVMTRLLEIYKCDVCGNMIEKIHAGVGELVCCNQPMKLMTENTTDASKEKHVPFVEKTVEGMRVQVGSIPHPMEEKHYIEWIEVIAGNKAYRQFLKPGQPPEAKFNINEKDFTVREYCNLHGLWRK